MKYARLFLFVILWVAVCAAAYAADVKIGGKVTDAEGNPIEFATVRIGGTAIGTNTDLQGYYSFTVAQKDTLDVIFTSIGFKELKQRLIKPEKEVTLNVYCRDLAAGV